MKISVVIPTCNQAAYLEETLRSALDQGYPELELIVADGGSTDGTRELLERHSGQLAWWVSERDAGQTDAINKGLRHATGDVWSYLNSDDLLLPGSLARIAEAFADPAVMWAGAVSTIFDGSGEIGRIVPTAPTRMRDYLTPWSRPMQHVHPCSNVCFMRRAVLERIGFFDPTYHYGMDMEFYTRAVFAGFEMLRLPDVLGEWRWHGESKTAREGSAFAFLVDELRIAEKYVDRLPPAERERVHYEIAGMHQHLAVRRAQFEEPRGNRVRVASRLLAALARQPGLISFRPWLGALRRAVFGGRNEPELLAGQEARSLR